MHIEPIGKKAFLWILKSAPFLSAFAQSEMDKNEMNKNEMNKNEDVIYCLFDYKNRSSLTKDAKVTFMKELL
ncbi:MAG: hypothetical protein IJ733_04280 [Lachnospiraceae bacterium]|nr:hypothetical protein [Lachnospiraceae bacterium]